MFTVMLVSTEAAKKHKLTVIAAKCANVNNQHKFSDESQGRRHRKSNI